MSDPKKVVSSKKVSVDALVETALSMPMCDAPATELINLFIARYGFSQKRAEAAYDQIVETQIKVEEVKKHFMTHWKWVKRN